MMAVYRETLLLPLKVYPLKYSHPQRIDNMYDRIVPIFHETILSSDSNQSPSQIPRTSLQLNRKSPEHQKSALSHTSPHHKLNPPHYNFYPTKNIPSGYDRPGLKAHKQRMICRSDVEHCIEQRSISWGRCHRCTAGRRHLTRRRGYWCSLVGCRGIRLRCRWVRLWLSLWWTVLLWLSTLLR